MIEKIKKISNPLTIIAIFAAIAEISGTVAIGLLDKEIQKIFIWFVMGFPTALVLIFFFILYKKHHVLYAPQDWRDDESFFKASETEKLFYEQLRETVESKPISKDNKEDIIKSSSAIVSVLSKVTLTFIISVANRYLEADELKQSMIKILNIKFDENKNVEQIAIGYLASLIYDYSDILFSIKRHADKKQIKLEIKKEVLELINKRIKELNSKE